MTINGDVTVQIKSGTPNTSYTVQFFQFPSAIYFNVNQPAGFDVSTALTDASGSGQVTFHFPSSGVWSGQFVLLPAGGDGSTNLSSDSAAVGGEISAALVPMSKMNNGRSAQQPPAGSPQEPGSGTIALTAGTVNIMLNGATANSTYSVAQCFTAGSSSCQFVGSFSTDASGNGTASLKSVPGTGSNFEVYRGGANSALVSFGFVTGFTVP